MRQCLDIAKAGHKADSERFKSGVGKDPSNIFQGVTFSAFDFYIPRFSHEPLVGELDL